MNQYLMENPYSQFSPSHRNVSSDKHFLSHKMDSNINRNQRTMAETLTPYTLDGTPDPMAQTSMSRLRTGSIIASPNSNESQNKPVHDFHRTGILNSPSGEPIYRRQIRIHSSKAAKAREPAAKDAYRKTFNVIQDRIMDRLLKDGQAGKESDNSLESASGPRLTSFDPKIKANNAAKNDSNLLSYKQHEDGGEQAKGRRSATERMAEELVNTVRTGKQDKTGITSPNIRKLKIISTNSPPPAKAA